MPQALNEQARHVTYMVIADARERGVKTLEPTPEARPPMCRRCAASRGIGERFYRECTPGYYNSEGAAGNKNGFFSEMYGAGSLLFFDVLDKWRANGRMEGLELR